MRDKIYSDQVVAGFVQQGIQDKEELLIKTLEDIQKEANQSAAKADRAFAAAQQCIERVRDFVGNPERILGSDSTKHGEIAEHIEVEIHNGRRILEGLKPNASLDVGRTAPEDYLVDGRMVQSKFIQSPRGTLDAVIEHSHKYSFFVSEDGYYHTPKEQYELFMKVANGEQIEGMKLSTIETIKNKISQIENETGMPFSDVVKPGISKYDEVQLGKVGQTLDKYEKEFSDKSAQTKKDIIEERRSKTESAQHMTDPSWGEAFKYAAVGAVITGTASAAINVYKKIKGGKKITRFTVEDWKDVGLDFGKNGIKGGISGLGIYGLTKLGGFSAPFAGAITSSAMGIASLAYDYKKEKITKQEFSDCACALSVEAGIAAIGSAVGQAVIPIPALGAIIGSATAKAALMLTKHVMDGKEKQLIEQMQKTYDSAVSKLDSSCREIIKKIDDYYNKLGGLIESALNKDVNLRLTGSIELARYLKVNESEILHSISETDAFMKS